MNENESILFRLTPFYSLYHDNDAYIHYSKNERHPGNSFIPYVGNGYFGLTIEKDAHLTVKQGRSLEIDVNFHPIVSVLSKNNKENFEETFVTDYYKGIVKRFACYRGFYANYEYYAHRNHKELFLQEIVITNTLNDVIDVELVLPRISDWIANKNQIKLQAGAYTQEFQVMTGIVDVPDTKKVKIVSIVSRNVPRIHTLKKKGVTKIDFFTIVVYSDPIERSQYNHQKDLNEKDAIEKMKNVLEEFYQSESSSYAFKRSHTDVWKNIWFTGFQISSSKAENALNGDRINHTIYIILSQVRAFESEQSITPSKRQEIFNALSYSENCYAHYPTLQAENLWKSLSSLEDINNLVSIWLLTLEKNGCHNLLKAGASGVIQAMVLSFGGFRFSNNHLEFNIHPKYLHRDYHFRRLNYGNLTHVNVSVSVNAENKAVLFVSVDRAEDKLPYYACDGGCLDEPIPLTHTPKELPVKLTEPLTSLLYVTTDKRHMEDLRLALHVKEIIEAPAHQSHILNLHKHGHSNLGGLPTLFWFSICAIILIFHIFLFRLIIKEYCGDTGSEKIKYRYLKP